MKFYFTLIALTIVRLNFGQISRPEWAFALNNMDQISIAGVVQTANNDVVVAGAYSISSDFDPSPDTYQLSAVAGTDIYFAKYTASGELIFAKSFGGLGYDYLKGVSIDASGNIYLIGDYSGQVDFDPGPGTFYLYPGTAAENHFFAKFDSIGNFVFAISFVSDRVISLRKEKIDSDGNIILSGYFQGDLNISPSTTISSEGYLKLFFTKFDSNGNLLFINVLDDNNLNIMGSPFIDMVYLDTDFNNNIYCAGYASDATDFDPSPAQTHIVTIDSTSCFLAKYDKNGALIFVTSMRTDAFSIVQSAKTTLEGKTVLQMSFYGGSSVNVDPGITDTTFFIGGPATGMIVAYDSTGKFLNAKVFNSCCIYSSDMFIDDHDNISITGAYWGTIDLGGGEPQNIHTATGMARNSFIATYDERFNCLNSTVIESEFNCVNTYFSQKEDNLVLTGYFENKCDFDLGNDSLILHSVAGYDIYVAKYKIIKESESINLETENLIYPNPVSDLLHINNKGIQYTIDIVNEMGQSIFQNHTTANRIDISSLSAGIYYIILNFNGETTVNKLVRISE